LDKPVASNAFEWKAIKGQRAKRPYAIAMKDGTPFGIAGLWENWKEPMSGEWLRTFVVITTDANELVAQIHNRMPVILPPNIETSITAQIMYCVVLTGWQGGGSSSCHTPVLNERDRRNDDGTTTAALSH
jgi:SOS response associated peptidase (SRAP)